MGVLGAMSARHPRSPTLEALGPMPEGYSDLDLWEKALRLY